MNRVEYLRGKLDWKKINNIVEEQKTIFTHSQYKNHSLPIRKARALELLLDTTPIHIYPEELIVGMSFRERPNDKDPTMREVPPELVSGEGYITFSRNLIAKRLENETYHPIIQSLTNYGCSQVWGIFPHYATPSEITEAKRFGMNENSNPGHLQVGYASILENGWIGLKRLAMLSQETTDKNTELGNRQNEFLDSVIICLEAASKFAIRYSELAKTMAEKEKVPRRKRELEKISKICENVAHRAPETWWEALQLLWFSHLISKTQGAHQIGRFDQYMWPILENNLKYDMITEEEAQELLECLWIKFSSLTDSTMDNLQNLILGGQTPSGIDATNPLSYMCLKATDKLGTIDPKWSIRVHSNSPSEFLTKAASLIKKNTSQPGIYNDEIIIKALRKLGVPLEDARDYTNDGCSEILVQGRSNPWPFEAKIKLLKCLERVIVRLGEFGSYDDLISSLKSEISVAVCLAASSANIIQRAVPNISPNPWVSASVEGCLEKKMDITEGGAKYNYSSISATGLAETVDSLAAVKKLVYEEAKVGKDELLTALRDDYAGHERLRQMLLNKAPKFGNDEDYVDSIAADLVHFLSSEVTKYRNPRGGSYTLGLFTYGEYIGHGMIIGATPDGRKSGQGISPNFSPSPGRDRKGPYATMKSTVKVDQTLTADGTALDLTLHPTSLSGPESVDKLVKLLRTFNKLGGMQVQFNIVDAEILKAAQLEPEKYRNLTVRLWGLPAYFTRLPKEFQDHLIARSSHKI